MPEMWAVAPDINETDSGEEDMSSDHEHHVMDQREQNVMLVALIFGALAVGAIIVAIMETVKWVP